MERDGERGESIGKRRGGKEKGKGEGNASIFNWQVTFASRRERERMIERGREKKETERERE